MPAASAPSTTTSLSATVRAGFQLAPFALLHAAAFSAFWVPFDPRLIWWFVGSYTVRTFGVTARYLRYFSHRSCRLGRVAQALMAVLAQTSGQKGVLWWEIDLTYMGLRLLGALGIATDLRPFIVGEDRRAA